VRSTAPTFRVLTWLLSAGATRQVDSSHALTLRRLFIFNFSTQLQLYVQGGGLKIVFFSGAEDMGISRNSVLLLLNLFQLSMGLGALGVRLRWG
jgi:hypothetical protein